MQIGKSKRAVSGIAMRRPTVSRCAAATSRPTSWDGSASPIISSFCSPARMQARSNASSWTFLLVAIAEHGLVPTVLAARMTLAADPGSLQGAVAAGILGAGPVILGTSELCGRLLTQADAEVAAGGEPDAVALALVRAIRDAGGEGAGLRPPGPQAASIRARCASWRSPKNAAWPDGMSRMARRIESAVAAVWGEPLVMNVSMPIARSAARPRLSARP